MFEDPHARGSDLLEYPRGPNCIKPILLSYFWSFFKINFQKRLKFLTLILNNIDEKMLFPVVIFFNFINFLRFLINFNNFRLNKSRLKLPMKNKMSLSELS